MERKTCLILCITAVFLISVPVFMGTMKQPLNNENLNNEPVIMKIPTISYTPHAPIVISSNADFISQGWPGGGIEGNPYVIEGLAITSTDIGISISDTTSYFEIRNCFVTSDQLQTYDGITFNYVENGKILNTVINGTWYGVRIDNSVDVVLMNNAAFDNVDTFIIFSSDYIEVTNNTASNNYGSGFILSLSSSCTLKNNTASFNQDYGISVYSGSSNNEIYYNHIGYNDAANARDNGGSNSWDDGALLGNYWCDYNCSGTYVIPGSAGSVDYYPRGWGEQESIPPTIDSPLDIEYEAGIVGHYITWTPADTNPRCYYIYKNHVLIDYRDWDGSPISVNVDGLPTAIYNYTIIAYDTSCKLLQRLTVPQT